MSAVLILEGARTPFATWAGGKPPDGSPGGKLKPFDPFDLGAAALKGALARSTVEAARLDRVVLGNMYHVGPHACYGARYVAHRAGVPAGAAALTVSIACGTGLYALSTAAELVGRGEAGLVGAVGADSASLVSRKVFVPSFWDLSCGQHIARTAQTLAREYGLSRLEQDRWALESHRRALRARRAGLLAAEIAPLGEAREDDAILPAPTPEAFAASDTLFDDDPGATHGNTHAIVDGASAVVLASESAAAGLPHPPLGRYVTSAIAATVPERMVMASVAAAREALARAGLAASDIDLFEINETFAAQVLIDIRELGIPEERVNVNGGAIALGHPFGGTGPRLVHTALLELRRRKLKRALASISIGGGQGIAVIVEAI